MAMSNTRNIVSLRYIERAVVSFPKETKVCKVTPNG
jgi:hypothetical protein